MVYTFSSISVSNSCYHPLHAGLHCTSVGMLFNPTSWLFASLYEDPPTAAHAVLIPLCESVRRDEWFECKQGAHLHWRSGEMAAHNVSGDLPIRQSLTLLYPKPLFKHTFPRRLDPVYNLEAVFLKKSTSQEGTYNIVLLICYSFQYHHYDSGRNGKAAHPKCSKTMLWRDIFWGRIFHFGAECLQTWLAIIDIRPTPTELRKS